MPTNNPRITITLPDDLHKRIDEYWHEHKFKSQTQAINDLVVKGFRAINANPNVEHVIKGSHSSESMRIAAEYELLDSYGKKAVRAILEVELCRLQESQVEKRNVVDFEEHEPMITLPYFLESAAAGVPLWTEGEYEDMDFPASFVPDGADFAVGITGRSMEPDYPEGCTVFVHKTEQINDGDVVIAWLQGEGTVIKRALVVGDKIIRLESINREYSDIVGHKLDGVKIFGKVLGYIE